MWNEPSIWVPEKTKLRVFYIAVQQCLTELSYNTIQLHILLVERADVDVWGDIIQLEHSWKGLDQSTRVEKRKNKTGSCNMEKGQSCQRARHNMLLAWDPHLYFLYSFLEFVITKTKKRKEKTLSQLSLYFLLFSNLPHTFSKHMYLIYKTCHAAIRV